MTKKERKMMAMQAATTLTACTIGKVAVEMPLDPDIANERTKQMNLMVWRVFRIFHEAVVDAVESENWTSPTDAREGIGPVSPEVPSPDLTADV